MYKFFPYYQKIVFNKDVKSKLKQCKNPQEQEKIFLNDMIPKINKLYFLPDTDKKKIKWDFQDHYRIAK